MIKRTIRLQEPINQQLNNYFPEHREILFDIETTGLSWRSSHLYLIGTIHWKSDTWIFTQWFLDHPLAEKEMLQEFALFLQDCRAACHAKDPQQTLRMVHFNGDTFDLPYLSNKYRFYHLDDPFADVESLDLYKAVRKCKKVLPLTSMKQKDVETYLGITRDDQMTGKELIAVYYDYLKAHEEQPLELLLLHNHDDVLGLTELLPMLSIYDFLLGGFEVADCRTSADAWTLTLCPKHPLPARFLAELPHTQLLREPLADTLRLTADTTKDPGSIELSIPLLEETMKHFFADYKNYYYLPLEDQAIHKDVALYVDAANRVKAKKETCYQKKAAAFLPDPDALYAPTFRRSYREKLSWFIPDASFADDREQLRRYVQSLLLPIKPL